MGSKSYVKIEQADIELVVLNLDAARLLLWQVVDSVREMDEPELKSKVESALFDLSYAMGKLSATEPKLPF